MGQYVHDQARTNGMESSWSILNRGYHSIYHKISPKQLDCYVTENAGRHNVRPLDTELQKAKVVKGAERKRLRYSDLIAD